MLLPEFTYGLKKETSLKAGKIARNIMAGKLKLSELMNSLLDTKDYDCLIIIDENRLIDEKPHFRLYPLMKELAYKVLKAYPYEPQNLELTTFQMGLFQTLIQTDFVTLGLMSNNWGMPWFVNEKLQLQFIKSCLDKWNVFESIGKRYINGGNIPKHIWCVSDTLHYALCQNGVPKERIQHLLKKCFDDYGLYKEVPHIDLKRLLMQHKIDPDSKCKST